MGTHYVIALFIDYSVGIFFGLILNKYFTFKIKEKIDFSIIGKSIISNVFIFLMNIIILYVFIDMFKIDPYIAQLIALIAIAISSYFFYKYYIFKDLTDG